MNRSQKHWFLASMGAHALLLLILVLGSAFLVPKEQETKTSHLRVVPSILVDDALAGGGGNPKIKETDDRQKGDTMEPKPPQPPPEPPKVEPKVPDKPKDLAKVEPPPVVKDVPKVVKDPPKVEKVPDKPVKPAPVKEKVNLKDLKPVTRDTAKAAAAAAAQKARAQAERDQLARELKQTADAVASGFAGGTVVEVSGPGGEAYANYASVVRAIYDDAWLVTDDVTDDNTTTVVRVTIASDGNVISARVQRPSGNRALDNSVEATLRKVKFVRPFPAGSKDKQRTFTINFNLRAKRAIG